MINLRSITGRGQDDTAARASRIISRANFPHIPDSLLGNIGESLTHHEDEDDSLGDEGLGEDSIGDASEGPVEGTCHNLHV